MVASPAKGTWGLDEHPYHNEGRQRSSAVQKDKSECEPLSF